MFKDTDDAFIKVLVRMLQPQVLLRGDYLFRMNEPGDCMYFIKNGCVQIKNLDCTVVFATLKPGAYFGELAMLTQQRRTATAQASTDGLLAIADPAPTPIPSPAPSPSPSPHPWPWPGDHRLHPLLHARGRLRRRDEGLSKVLRLDPRGRDAQAREDARVRCLPPPSLAFREGLAGTGGAQHGETWTRWPPHLPPAAPARRRPCPRGRARCLPPRYNSTVENKMVFEKTRKKLMKNRASRMAQMDLDMPQEDRQEQAFNDKVRARRVRVGLGRKRWMGVVDSRGG